MKEEWEGSISADCEGAEEGVAVGLAMVMVMVAICNWRLMLPGLGFCSGCGLILPGF